MGKMIHKPAQTDSSSSLCSGSSHHPGRLSALWNEERLSIAEEVEMLLAMQE